MKLYYTGADPTPRREWENIMEWGKGHYDRKPAWHQMALVTWRIFCYVIAIIIMAEALVCLVFGDIITGIAAAALTAVPIGIKDCTPSWWIRVARSMEVKK